MSQATRVFRFGIQAGIGPDAIDDSTAFVDHARRAEALGFSVMTVPDHYAPMLAPIAGGHGRSDGDHNP